MTNQPYPLKEAPNDYPIADLIKKRWSPVIFSNQPIDQEKINSLFEAMRWAPSSRNEQPWLVVYATQDQVEDFKRIADLLDEGNAYAKNAYLLLVVFGKRHHNYKNKPNVTYQYDTGAGAENLFLQAVSMDLIAHEMGGYNREKSYEVLNVSQDSYESIATIAVGYPGDPTQATAEQKTDDAKPRQRKSISEFVFNGKVVDKSEI
ncbi:MAG: nitroreductase family protein [Candidatus Buchananbacteria bacterium]|nr:nitroreductase family protein [Candidatus Buchananbacteria bacterium]